LYSSASARTKGGTPLEEEEEGTRARKLVEKVNGEVEGAKDCLLAAKISQAHHANKGRSIDPEFAVGDKVMLKTAHRRRDYMQRKGGRVAKFMPRWDGPYELLEVFPESSTYKLALLNAPSCCATFHVSLLKRHIENNNELFPGRQMDRPGPIVTAKGSTEYFVGKIIDERPCGRGRQYLVRWKGYGPEADLWLPRSELLKTEALALWEKRDGGA
jgi:hypothetical protein